MSDFISIRKGRNVLSVVMHMVLNLALAVGSTAITIATQSWVLGVLLVFLSKWRMLAVRSRYWFLNLKSNIVDIVVGVSLVMLVYYAGVTEIKIAHVVWTVVYAVWLLVIKPRSSELMTETQSLVAVFLGMSAGSIMASNLDSAVIAIGGFVVGYGASRHILAQSEDHDFTMITFVSGLIMAEVSWLLYHWLIVYSFGSSGLVIPQLAVVATLATFLFIKAYKSIIRHDGKMKLAEVVMPTVFSVLVIVIMVLWFSKPMFNV